MLFIVYDLKGEKFEVAPHIAKELIIEKGWGINPPTDTITPSSEESVIVELEKEEDSVNSPLK